MDAVLEQAKEFGVRKFIFPSKSINECKVNLNFCKRIPCSYTTIGLNTSSILESHFLKEEDTEEKKLKAIEKYFEEIEEIIEIDRKEGKRIVAIGECSLEEGT